MKKMKGVVIDPAARRVYPVEFDYENFRSIYPMIGADTFDCVDITSGTDGMWLNQFGQEETMFVDDEGLLKPNKLFSLSIKGLEGRVFAGKSIILGTDKDGDTVSTKMHFSVIRSCVEWA